MSVWALLAIIVLIGLVVYGIRRFVPMDAPFQNLVLIVGLLVAVAIVLYAFGLLPAGNVAVPKLR